MSSIGKNENILVLIRRGGNTFYTYVPNVVYTCGAIIHHDTLVIPYAVSDTASGIATVRMQPLLERLLGQ